MTAPEALSITTASANAELLDLPWQLPLDSWPAETIAALPKGISRHLVRFAHLGADVVAIKETTAEMARAEYELLQLLQRLGIPAVEPLAVITGRTDAAGEPLAAVLVTSHLRFSLPYRALYSSTLRPDTAARLVDAAAVLLVRLHIAGFFWGDVSLSNTLFRRDAGAFTAYLVDAETGEHHPTGLSDGQREHDLEIARVNIAGELLDLQSGRRLDDTIEPIETANGIVAKYRSLWTELTAVEHFDESERWRITDRIQRLNSLGYDIGELSISTDEGGTTVHIQPKVVDAGHHSRRLLQLTGLDAHENQARRLLNDLDAYIARHDRHDDVEQAAHEWTVRVFEPVVRAIPSELTGKLEPAELFHQLLDHRWTLSQEGNRDVPLAEALASYIDDVLRHRKDEAQVLHPVTEAITLPIDVTRLDSEDWRSSV